MKTLTQQDTIKQSTDAYKQWKDIWHENAKRNAAVANAKGTSIKDIASMGRNRLGILVAMGQSLENHIDDLRGYTEKEGVDVLCVDKAFGLLMDHGVVPAAVVVSDAQVVLDKWVTSHLKSTKNIPLIISATANPIWAESWEGPVYILVNKDSIKTEAAISEITGCYDLVPASANVGNALVVVSAEYLAYKELLLVGYDYSWLPGENYYAFSGDADGIMENKRCWQLSGYSIGNNDKLTMMSENLTFAARWLKNYYLGKVCNLPTGLKIYNCSRQGILDDIPGADLNRRIDLFTYIALTEQEMDQVRVSRARVIRAKTEQELREVFEKNIALHADILCVPKEVMP